MFPRERITRSKHNLSLHVGGKSITNKIYSMKFNKLTTHNTEAFHILSCEGRHLRDTAFIFRETRKRGKGRRINYVKMRVNSLIVQRINDIDETEIDPVKIFNLRK